MRKLFVFLLVSGSVFGAEKSLEDKLEQLNVPTDRVSPLLSQEELYAVNQRYSSLNRRFEFTMFGAHDFAADSHMDSKQTGATARFHINSKWSLGARYTEYFNKLTPAGEELFERESLLPDTDFALKSSDFFVNYNTTYGKMRLTEDAIVYFDQYVSFGYGTIALSQGETQMYLVDLGFAFWGGSNFSARFGVRNEFYTQQKQNGEDNVHNAMGYVEMGYLFGEGSRI